ncbi:MAG: helix-turn-helix domain-containing protein [Solirubrobacteraceae bacterium]
MTATEAAAAVGVSADTLRRWVREGVVPEYGGAELRVEPLAPMRLRGFSEPTELFRVTGA